MGVSARTHAYTCIHTASLHSRSWEDADTFYPGTRSTRRRTRNGKRERRPCWTGIRLSRTRPAAAPPARAPVGSSVRPSVLAPSLRARLDGLAQAPPQRRSARPPARRPHESAGARAATCGRRDTPALLPLSRQGAARGGGGKKSLPFQKVVSSSGFHELLSAHI